MSNNTNRYLELCSNTRNRVIYPNPGYFEVNISQSGTKGKYQALDPISSSAPVIEWTPVTMIGNGGGAGSVSSNNENTTSHILVTFPTTTYQTNHNPDYYAGLPITIGTTTTIIISSSFQANQSGADSFWLTVSPSLSTIPIGGTAVISLNTVDTTNGVIWVPGCNYADHFYANGYIIWNDTTKTYTPIIGFNGSILILWGLML